MSFSYGMVLLCHGRSYGVARMLIKFGRCRGPESDINWYRHQFHQTMVRSHTEHIYTGTNMGLGIVLRLFFFHITYTSKSIIAQTAASSCQYIHSTRYQFEAYQSFHIPTTEEAPKQNYYTQRQHQYKQNSGGHTKQVMAYLGNQARHFGLSTKLSMPINPAQISESQPTQNFSLNKLLEVVTNTLQNLASLFFDREAETELSFEPTEAYDSSLSDRYDYYGNCRYKWCDGESCARKGRVGTIKPWIW